ncbi:MAG TPA: insulinase family protein, partial [Candidatus Nanoarchaeia archaeon]|nr:insulinase family protein [Candidatus Nanoarchaeia archaeon]
NQLRGGIQMDMENNVKMSDQYGSELLLLNKILPTEEWLAMIDAVTPEDVQRVAGELLDPKRLRLAIIGPDPTAAENRFKELLS